MTITHCCAFGTFPYHHHAPSLYSSSSKLRPIARNETDAPQPKRRKFSYDVTSISTDKMDVDVSDPLARDQHIEHNAVFRSDIQAWLRHTNVPPQMSIIDLKEYCHQQGISWTDDVRMECTRMISQFWEE